MDAMPIDNNSAATNAENARSRGPRKTIDTTLRGARFEQLLLAISLPKSVASRERASSGTSSHDTASTNTATRFESLAQVAPTSSDTFAPDVDADENVKTDLVPAEKTSAEKSRDDAASSAEIAVCHLPMVCQKAEPIAEESLDTDAAATLELALEDASSSPLPTPAESHAEALETDVQIDSGAKDVDSTNTPATELEIEGTKRERRSRKQGDEHHQLATAPQALVEVHEVANASDKPQREVRTAENDQPAATRLESPAMATASDVATPVAKIETTSDQERRGREESPLSANQSEPNRSLDAADTSTTSSTTPSVAAATVPAVQTTQPSATPVVSLAPAVSPNAASPPRSQGPRGEHLSVGGINSRLSARAFAPPKSTEPNGSSQIDTVKFVQRIARAMQAARESGGEIRLRLSPPELGSLKMEVKMSEGAMIARVETETAQAQSVLVDNLPALKERLAEQGVRIEQFDVDVQQHGGQSEFAGGRDEGDRRRPEPSSLPTVPSRRETAHATEGGSVTGSTGIGTNARGINVVA